MSETNENPAREASLAFWKAVKVSAEYVEHILSKPSGIGGGDEKKLQAATHVLEIAFKKSKD